MTDDPAATDPNESSGATGADVLVPGGRDVRATLDRAGETPAEACVVACPPHPQHRGHRGDQRLRAVSDRLGESGVDCLRFDYGDWDDGYGELADTRNALEWARERYARVGLFGFSFGGCLALLAAGGMRPSGHPDGPEPLRAVSALAPAARIDETLDATRVMDRVECPGQVVYGTRDDTADWEPAVEEAERLGWNVVDLPADHFFVGQHGKVADAAGAWLADHV